MAIGSIHHPPEKGKGGVEMSHPRKLGARTAIATSRATVRTVLTMPMTALALLIDFLLSIESARCLLCAFGVHHHLIRPFVLPDFFFLPEPVLYFVLRLFLRFRCVHQ